MIESKGVYVLLEACKVLYNKGYNFHCTFIGGEGDITSQTFLEKINKMGLSENVVYLGKKYGKEKEKYLSKTDIFVFPTYYHNETFGLVNLEAMQFCIPIVSTFEGAIPDIVKDGITGLLVRQRDFLALAEKIEILIQNPELRYKMGEEGRRRYEKNYTIEIFEKNIESILKKIILK